MSEPPVSEPLSLDEGQTLGDFTIERKIGSGAMADVFLARQNSLGRNVALKILRPELAVEPTHLRRFVQEAQTAARLEHPNIVRIYEVGLFPPAKRSFAMRLFDKSSAKKRAEPLHYIAEEYVSGMSLALYLRRHGPLSPRQTLGILTQTTLALAEAAASGIVHRDVKPENILLSESGRVKVADFGLAFLSPNHRPFDDSLTQVGVALGTPLYMSPEQARSEPLDWRSDVYSLGITAFWMLTGRVPFTAETPLAVLLMHLNQPAPRVRTLRPETPEALDEIVARMTAKKPDDRYAAPEELFDALRKARKELDASFAPGVLSAPDNLAAPDILTASDASEEAVSQGVATDESGETFFDGLDDALSFSRQMESLGASRQLQRDFSAVRSLKRQEGARWGGRRYFRALTLTLGIAFLLGGGSALLGRWLLPARRGTPPTAIHPFDTVEEQSVFAAQVGTAEAWRSVSEYFPKETYWTRRADRQLARVLMLRGETQEARNIFRTFAESPVADTDFRAFGLAGLAWTLAADGKTDEAAALLSDLRSGPRAEFDRLTEEVISRAQALIRDAGGGENRE